MLFYEPDRRDRDLLPHDPFKAVIAPRPIGWMSTIGPDGELNLAPYSFFNAVGENPPMLGFSSSGAKHSATFAHAGGEFVWNMPTWKLREAMNQTSATLPRDESEWEFAGLETAPSRLVAPPRVAASPCALECKVVHSVELQDVDGRPADQYFVVAPSLGPARRRGRGGWHDDVGGTEGRVLTARDEQPVGDLGAVQVGRDAHHVHAVGELRAVG